MENFPKFNLFSDFSYQDFYLIKDDIIHKIIVQKNYSKLIIKSNHYSNMFSLNDFSKLVNNFFYSLNDAYEYLINKFEENQLIIKKTIVKKEMKLILILNAKKEIEIDLFFQKRNNDFILLEINKIKNDINNLKKENHKLKNEIEILKKYHVNKIPKDIKLISEISKDSYADYGLDNIFIVFKAINDLLYLIYSSENKSIICYDLNNQIILSELKNCHDEYITNLRHYLDEIHKRDLILSISNEDNNIKIWNLNNFECIINIPHVNINGFLYSACVMKDNNQNYIISSNYNEVKISEKIKIFDFYGNKIKEINNSNEITFLIDIYYDEILNKNYIITGNLNYVKSYDYNNNELYHKYADNGNGYHFSIIINSINNIIRLIESCEDGNIRIWHFHSGLLIKKIKIIDENLNGICLWNNNYLFVGCDDTTIKLIDLKNGLIIDEIKGHNREVLSIKKIYHSIYGECLISQGYEEDQFTIWGFL